MVSTFATGTVLPVASLPIHHKSSKSSFAGNLDFKSNILKPTKINSTSLKTRDGEVSSPSSSSTKKFLKQVMDRNMFLNPVRIFEETKETEVRSHDKMLFDESATNSRNFLENGPVFRQNISIRSYEIGADGRLSLESLMSHLQETGLNHMKAIGLLGDGLGSTPEMAQRNLFWVATKVQLVLDRCPTWGDDIVIDDWMVASGKHCMRRDSVIRDCKTGQTLIKASSNWVMMNKETRRLSRIPEEVHEELRPHQMEATPIIEEDTNKLQKLDEDTSDFNVTGLKLRWSDLDINQHVNNAKYIGWVLESAPPTIRENHEISHVTMEYRRECHRDDVLQSLTSVSCGAPCDFLDSGNVECNHLLQLEGGADEVMKARTQWRPKNVCTLRSLSPLGESNS